MQNQFSQREKSFLNNAKPEKNKFWTLLFVLLLAIFVAGIITDAINGFTIIRSSQNIVGGIGGIFVLGLLYILAESGGQWFGGKDSVSQPLGRRVINLILLLSFVAILCVVFYYVHGVIT